MKKGNNKYGFGGGRDKKGRFYSSGYKYKRLQKITLFILFITLVEIFILLIMFYLRTKSY